MLFKPLPFRTDGVRTTQMCIRLHEVYCVRFLQRRNLQCNGLPIWPTCSHAMIICLDCFQSLHTISTYIRCDIHRKYPYGTTNWPERIMPLESGIMPEFDSAQNVALCHDYAKYKSTYNREMHINLHTFHCVWQVTGER